MSNVKLSMLVIAEGNTLIDPRPKRIIDHFYDKYNITTIGLNISEDSRVKTYSYPSYKKRSFWNECKLYINIFLKRYMTLVEIPTRKKIYEFLNENSFDIIICHSLVLLPIVLKGKKKSKVIFDAREYYPSQNEDNFRWRLLFKDFNHWLCKSFLPKCDSVYTVSEGIKNRYEKNYNIDVNLVVSYPYYHDLSPDLERKYDKIRMIYHGVVNENRKIDLMIKMMDYLDDRFELDLMIVRQNTVYFKQIENLVDQCQNVNIIPTVKFDEIIPFSSQYDIGLYLLPPTNINTKYALPNKFFEFIQSRLVIAIGPSIEMAKIVKEHNLGIISNSFNPLDLAKCLNKLTNKEILQYKINANKVAKKLHNEFSMNKIEDIIKGVL